MEFPPNGLREQERQEHLAQVYFAERAWDALLAWYGPQTTEDNFDLSRQLKIAQGVTLSRRWAGSKVMMQKGVQQE